MQFKFKDSIYKISFSFLALILFIITVGKSRILGYLLLFAIAHEMVHLLFIYRFSVPPKRVAFTVFGANISRNITVYNNVNSEIIINASAPVFNIVTGAVFYLISKGIINHSELFTELSEINLVLGFFNLIPFYTFDGGNILKYILIKFFSGKVTEEALTWVSLAVTVAFSFLSIYIFLNYQHNFSLFIMCIYMFLSIIFKKENSLDY